MKYIIAIALIFISAISYAQAPDIWLESAFMRFSEPFTYPVIKFQLAHGQEADRVDKLRFQYSPNGTDTWVNWYDDWDNPYTKPGTLDTITYEVPLSFTDYTMNTWPASGTWYVRVGARDSTTATWGYSSQSITLDSRGGSINTDFTIENYTDSVLPPGYTTFPTYNDSLEMDTLFFAFPDPVQYRIMNRLTEKIEIVDTVSEYIFNHKYPRRPNDLIF